MTWFVLLGALGLALWPLVVAIRRGTELFLVKIRYGQASFVRGRMPQALLHDIADIVAAPEVQRAELWAVRRGGRAELRTRGELGAEQLQRLRNVLGCHSLQRILAGGRPQRGSRIARGRGPK